jgi:DNA primase
MLTDDKIAEIRDSVDLVALISEYVPLRRQGARFVGLCPFHQEKTPSFGVSRGKSFYYCFGCQASGDAISFLRHVEGLGFGEAIAKLAERSGIELPRSDDPAQAQIERARSVRERLSEVMAQARAFFEQALEQGEHAEIARAELDKRGVSPELVRRFHLGYAPLAWDGLARHLTQKRVDLHDAVEVGLIAPRRQGSGYYDRFRHRLMFPVADQHGRILAFSGRALAPPEGGSGGAGALTSGHSEAQQPPAKYINSPEGPLYKKGQVLFGLDNARVAMRKHNQALLCEGNFDLIALHQAGFEQTVAPLGTAFTLEQARLLRRFVEEVVVIFDGDGAGRKAMRAAFELLETAGIRGRAVRLPEGQDPDSFLRAKGEGTLRAMVQAAPPLIDFVIDELRDAASDAAGRARAIQSLGPLLARIESPVERDQYVQRVAQKFEIRDVGVVRAELRRGALAARGAEASKLSARGRAPAPEPTLRGQPASAPRMRRGADLPARQRDLLAALLEWPELLRREEARRLVTLLTDPDLQAIFLVTARMVEQRGEVDAPALLEELASNPARAWLGERLSRVPEYDRERAERVLNEGLPLLERDLRMEQRARLKREIQVAREGGDYVRAAELTRLRDELART